MAKTPAKKKPVTIRLDLAQNAFRDVQEVTGQAERNSPPKPKEPAAVARGGVAGECN